MIGTAAGDVADRLRRIVPDECLILPSSPEYDVARLVYNRMHSARPAAIVRSLDPCVLRAVVAFAVTHDVPLAVRGGGHHIGGFSTIDDGLLIDFSTFRRVAFEPRTGLVRVEPGARLRDLDASLAAYGRCVPSGTVSDTGITGLTLGGGIGWLVAGYGLTCDYLHGARVMLADGRIIDVSAGSHAELFYELRGGGMGAFGLVLELRFETVPLPRIMAGSIRFPLARAAHVLRRLRESQQGDTPSSITIAPVLHVRGGVPELSVDVCCHDADQYELDRVRRSIGGDWSGVINRSYPEWQSNFDAAFLPPMRGYWKSVHFNHLSLDPEVLVETFHAAPGDKCSVLIEFYNVETLRKHADGSAYPLRDSQLGVLLSSRWSDPRHDETQLRWARAGAETLRTAGGAKAYSNYSEAGDARMRSTYHAGMLDVLRRLEAAYDPGRIFARGHRAALVGGHGGSGGGGR